MPRKNVFSFKSVLLVFGILWKLSDTQVNREEANQPPDAPRGDGRAFYALRSCQQLLQSDAGEFFSPDYLCSNPPLWCNWTIQVDPAKRIHLDLEDLTPIDACHLKDDQVHVDEPIGHLKAHKVLQKCWREATYTSSSNTLYVVQLIGGWPSSPYRGFYGRYQAFGPPVVYNPQEGFPNRESEPSPGISDFNERVSNGEQLESEHPSPASSDLTYDYFSPSSDGTEPEEATDTESRHPHRGPLDREGVPLKPLRASLTQPSLLHLHSSNAAVRARSRSKPPRTARLLMWRELRRIQRELRRIQRELRRIQRELRRIQRELRRIQRELRRIQRELRRIQRELRRIQRKLRRIQRKLYVQRKRGCRRKKGFWWRKCQTGFLLSLKQQNQRRLSHLFLSPTWWSRCRTTEESSTSEITLKFLIFLAVSIGLNCGVVFPVLTRIKHHLFEVTVEVKFIPDVKESWDMFLSLLPSVKELISKQLKPLHMPLSMKTKRKKRLRAGGLYIIWLQIGQGPEYLQVHQTVHSNLHGLSATAVGVGQWEAVISSVSIADVNECGTQMVLCDVNADCVNRFGSYSCHCRPGFQDESRLGSGGTTCVDKKPAGCSSDLSPETKGVYGLFFLLSSLILLLLAAASLLYHRHRRGAFLVRCYSSDSGIAPPDHNNNNNHHCHHHDDTYLNPPDSDLPPPPPPVRSFREGWPSAKERSPALDLQLLRFSQLLRPDTCTEPQADGKN
ncbi:uncharacterized protein LOC144530909 [Sander vitreus]